MSLSFPLTTMEEFLYWEDRPAYPWSCFVRLRFSGCLDRAAFEAAVRTVLARHPLFAAKVETARPRTAAMVRCGRSRARRSSGRPLRSAARCLRPRTWICAGRSAFVSTCAPMRTDSDLTIQFHHACCDGAGFALFLKDSWSPMPWPMAMRRIAPVLQSSIPANWPVAADSV